MTDARPLIDRPASDPGADLACDFTIASEMARSGFREELAHGIVPPLRELPDGVEVTFRPEAWEAVRRYVELESQCCPFLSLAAEQRDGAVLLRVTGRTEARDLILGLFSGGAATRDCC